MDLFKIFSNPPDAFGPVPFWWWVGEPLTRERLAWQLDRLREKGVLNAIVSYNHTPTGEPDLGDPPLFSEDWWELFRWVVAECKARGMQIGFQDYTLVNRTLQEIGKASPEMRGFGSLGQTSRSVHGPAEVFLTMEEGAEIVAASAYQVGETGVQLQSVLDLTSQVDCGKLRWQAPVGEWVVTLISLLPNPFDPTHPDSGAKVIEELYAIFERNCPGELGKTIGILFQDELDFFNHTGAGFPVWSSRIEAEFLIQKGYPLRPWVAALWHDLGPMTAKVRIDYNDVCVTMMEKNYFCPIFEWCEEREILLGNDNCGRGRISEGHSFYGDAFRTMRWYGAPGNDDAGPVRGYAFPGFKINSSIAHLYQRPRVWNEAFHSSGWGFTPAQIIAGFNEDSTYGVTLFNLHGLYYTTYGSWWEWAAPDFHFRQPYWEHTDALSAYVRRISWLLGQGVHRCDVAILYPITTIEAGLRAEDSERHAFGLGRHLFDAGIDFDFVDFQSLERATVEDAELRVSGERYRVLVFPMMEAVRWSSLEKAREFVRNGGLVIAFGCLPLASERAGSGDIQLDALVNEISSAESGFFVDQDYEKVRRLIDEKIERDFLPSENNVLGLHRSVEGREVYFVFNRSDERREMEVTFRSTGGVQRWNAWQGTCETLGILAQTSHGTRLKLILEPREAQIFVLDASAEAPRVSTDPTETQQTLLELDGDWEFELVPTMDNRFGDFRLPPSDELMGAEARRFRYHEETSETEDASSADRDDSNWPEVTYSFGPRFWSRGPLQEGLETSKLEANFQMLAQTPGEGWEPYSFSLRWGIEDDAFLKHPYSGPHGLKKRVPDEFIDLGDHPEGEIFYLWTSVHSLKKQTVPMVMGSRSSYVAWLNHELVLFQSEALPPGEYAPWKLPHYESTLHRQMVTLQAGHNPLLLKFTIPAGQRMRAYVAFNPTTENLSPLYLPWFQNSDTIHFDYQPQQTQHAGWYRCDAPPGLRTLEIVAKGSLRVWVDGLEQKVVSNKQSISRVNLLAPLAHVSKVVLRIKQPPDSYAGDALLEPVRFGCGIGQTALRNWSELGLRNYSGGAWYRRTFSLERAQAADPSLVLDPGQVLVTAEIKLNGQTLGKCIAPPWQVSIAGVAREGENYLEIQVMNTLANHYSAGIPSPYAWPDQATGGLIGPVRILGVAK